MSYLNKNYLLFMFYKFLIILLTFKVTSSDSQHPCRNVLTLEHERTGDTIGLIKAPVSSDSYTDVIRLDVEISVENPVQGFRGNIELATPNFQVNEHLRQNRPLFYRVQFPHYDKIPPAVTKITLNGNQICSGNPVDERLASIVTLILLQHTLPIARNKAFLPNSANSGSESQPLPNLNTRPSVYPSYQFTDNYSRPKISYNVVPNSLKPDSSIYQPNNQNNKDGHQSRPIGENFPVSYSSRDGFTPPPSQRPETQTPTKFILEDTNPMQNPFPNVCGRPNRKNPLIVNGNSVGRGTHPWLAAIFKQSEDALRFTCGSTLISQKHVITAAHCVIEEGKKVKSNQLWIILGRQNIHTWSCGDSQTIRAEFIDVHPEYVLNTADADIAIITLAEEAVFSNIVKPICLWTFDKNVELIIERKGTVVGWGKDDTGKLYSPQLKQFDFPVVSKENCLRSNPVFREITSNRTFCAGYRNNTGPCNGDSGSGFFMRINDAWTIRGIVSISLLRDSERTCDLNEYVVYTDIAQFTDWVLSFLR